MEALDLKMVHMHKKLAIRFLKSFHSYFHIHNLCKYSNSLYSLVCHLLQILSGKHFQVKVIIKELCIIYMRFQYIIKI